MADPYTSRDSKNMIINAFEDDPHEGAGVSAVFKAAINPESFTHNRTITFNSENVSNSAFDVYQFQGYGKETVGFSLILDGTGYVNQGGDNVDKQLTDLLKVVYNYQSGSHKSHYNQLVWGGFKFYCHCESMNVTYSLFDSGGNGLIAEVELSFVIHRNKKKSMQGKNSPDMTHIHTYKDGDNLLALCKEIYDDTAYYIQIAELNGLSNFRHIPIGKQLIFPPLVNKD